MDGELHVVSQTEDLVRQICASCLGLPTVALDANFFQLGGESLTATQVLVQLRRRLGIKIALADFFDNPTVRMLAAVIDHAALNSADNLSEEALMRLLDNKDAS